MKKKIPVVLLTIICFIVSFTATLQIKSVRRNKAVVDTTAKSRLQVLQTEVLRLSEKNMELQEQNNIYKSDLDRFRSEAADSSDFSKILAEDLAKAELAAGLTDVTGPGAIVVISDSTSRSSSNGTVQVIHDSDLLMLINELRNAEAEAISINDQRIIATSEIRCSGSTITVNNIRCYAPFTIKAIGNYSKINSTLNMPEGFMDTMNYWDFPVNVQKTDNITIKGYSGKINNNYAKPTNTTGGAN